MLFKSFKILAGLTFLALSAVPLGAFRPAAPRPPAYGAAPGFMVLEGVTYENLTLFPVIATSYIETGGFLTLDQGLANGDVVVREMGNMILRRTPDGRPQYGGGGDEVNRLVLINRGKKPVLLIAGELVSGGKQDRIIAKDRIVAPGGAPLPLDVFCVEHGRWAGSVQFNASKVIVHPSVREQAVVVQSQTRVWASVREGTTASSGGVAGGIAGGVAGGIVGGLPEVPPPAISVRALDSVMETVAPTQSYAKVYTESRIGQSVESFSAEMERRFRHALPVGKDNRLAGIIVAYGGEVAWSDLFASHALLEQYWPKLLRSYATEALARPRWKERPTLDDARAFIEPLRGREQVETEPGVYRWGQTTEGRLVQTSIRALPTGLELHSVTIRKTGAGY